VGFSAPLAAGRLFATSIGEMARHRSESILLLDADRRTSQRLAALLEEDGFHVEALHDGASAIARFGRGPLPDTLITELSLPVTDGAAVARVALAQSPSMQIVVLTRYPNLVEPRLLGATSPVVLTKPLDYARLLEVLAGDATERPPSLRPASLG
jgi:CheY-like chemotaxis protein